MFLKNQNLVCLDVRAVKHVFALAFDQQHQDQNQNVATVVQSAQLAQRAMHQRVVVDQSRQPGQIDHVVSHEKPQIPSEHLVQKALQ
jgi:L-rhamnose isomerase